MLQILSPIIIIIILNLILFKNNQLFSIKLNLFDKPNLSRKLHKNPVPLNGGIFYFLNIIIIFVYDYFLNYSNISLFFGFENEIDIIYFFLIIFFLLFLGIIDDKLSLKPLTKTSLSLLLFFSFLIVNKSFHINELRLESFNFTIDLFNISLIFTIVCFSILQISFNMYDGINLQSSIYYICLTLFFLIISDDYGLKLFCILTIFYLIFFSIFNFRSKIFLGDNGVYIFSFIFSLIIIQIYNTSSKLYVESILILLLFPFLDLIRLFLVRLQNNINPFEGDRNHIHHILLNKFGVIKSNLILITPLIVSMILFYKFNFSLIAILLFKILIYLFLIKKKNNE